MPAILNVEDLVSYITVTHPPKPVIICEGDSWFAYPNQVLQKWHGTNIIDYIEDTNLYHVLRLETGGDEAAFMLCQGQRHMLDEVLCKLKHTAKMKNDNAYLPRYILFSGGGNDIVGEHDVIHFLNEYTPEMTIDLCFREDRYKIRLNQIKAAYLELIAFRDDYCPEAHILTHCYDHLIPTGKAAHFFGLIKVGAWLKPFIAGKPDEGGKGITDEALQQAIVDKMLNMFSNMLDELAGSYNNFHKINTFGSVGKDNWTNEIHPNEVGFKNVANLFIAKLNTLQQAKI